MKKNKNLELKKLKVKNSSAIMTVDGKEIEIKLQIEKTTK